MANFFNGNVLIKGKKTVKDEIKERIDKEKDKEVRENLNSLFSKTDHNPDENDGEVCS